MAKGNGRSLTNVNNRCNRAVKLSLKTFVTSNTTSINRSQSL